LPALELGRVRQKQRTRHKILAAAAVLVAAGKNPTVEQAADAAGVSRRTAYRYFPTQAKLLTEAALEGLRLPMEAMLAAVPPGHNPGDLELRLGELIVRMQAMAVRHEALLRTMIHETVLERAPASRPRRGTRRIDWIKSAIGPLRGQVGDAAYERLVSALALFGGIEALLVLRDIRGLREGEAVTVSRWAALALLRQTLLDAEVNPRRGGAKRRPLQSTRAR
jgi:AcrR family transcriptional regulator